MGNSLTKAKLNDIEVVAEIIKPTMLEKLITAREMLLIKIESSGMHTFRIKEDIAIQMAEISQLIGIINFMNESTIVKKFNIK